MAPNFEQFAIAAVLADSNQVVAVVDAEMMVRWVSPSAHAYGIDVVDRSLVELIHPDDLDRVAQAFEGVAQNAAFELSLMANAIVPIRISTPNGDIPFDVSGRWVADENGTGWLVTILQDVKTRHSTDQALRTLAAGADEQESIQAIVDSMRAFGGVEGAQMIWQNAGTQRTLGDLGSDPTAVADAFGDLGVVAAPGRALSMPLSDWAFALPVSAGHEGLGTMLLWGQGHAPNLDLVSAVMAPSLDLAALSLKRARELAELERRATRDQITDLLNRHAFFAAIDRIVHRAAIVYVDLDAFKAVNDEFGHTLGDRLLSVVGRRLVDAVGTSDLVGRIGGDEFAVLCSDVTADQARRAGEHIIGALNQTFVIDGHRIATGASIGVAYTDAPTSGRELLDTADRALLEAKAQGKGRAIVLANF